MVKQGEIIQINFNPQKGHEQAGYRPALVVSNNFYNKLSNLILVCPITNSNRAFPLHIPLDNRVKTTGYILCDQIRALDLAARRFKIVETVPIDILDKVIKVIIAEIKPTE